MFFLFSLGNFYSSHFRTRHTYTGILPWKGAADSIIYATTRRLINDEARLIITNSLKFAELGSTVDTGIQEAKDIDLWQALVGHEKR